MLVSINNVPRTHALKTYKTVTKWSGNVCSRHGKVILVYNTVNLCTPLCLMDGEPVYASMPNGVNLCTLCLMDGEPVYASMPTGVNIYYKLISMGILCSKAAGKYISSKLIVYFYAFSASFV